LIATVQHGSPSYHNGHQSRRSHHGNIKTPDSSKKAALAQQTITMRGFLRIWAV